MINKVTSWFQHRVDNRRIKKEFHEHRSKELQKRAEYEIHLGRPLTMYDIPVPKKPWNSIIWWYTLKCRVCGDQSDMFYSESKNVTRSEFQHWVATYFKQGFEITDCSSCNQLTVQDLIRIANKDGEVITKQVKRGSFGPTIVGYKLK